MFNYYNSEYLYSIKPKKNILVPFIILLVITIITLSYYYETYDVLSTNSYVECTNTCNIKVSNTPNLTGKINNIDYLLINSQRVYHYKKIINDIEQDSANNYYQIIEFEIDNINIPNKTMQDIKIYYNKERIFKKIIHNLFE